MTDQFHITATQMRALVALLGEIPALIDDLAITLTRQDCIGAGGMRVTGGSDEQPLPINLAASDAHDLLHSTLASWARHTEESRGHAYTGPRSTIGLSTWLATNVTRLAMTEGCEEAHDEIEHAMSQCRRVCDLPADPYWKTAGTPDQARATELPASGIAVAAKSLGPEYAELTRDRVNGLHKTGRITAVRVLEDTPIYRLGDVMDAHVATPTRRRKKTA
ncbi:hypothetical protein MWT96_20360 [Prescottella equi]|uniref:hypothetical protein n=1 Tax=Rhodococcus hoagii TaxID=43767 RepID=UPI001A0D79A4|nr:hypothetical protein [Prescottella equi]NKT97297.1 hypothetical protein [Prescottella equi]UPH36726.1 hypothetical protein GS533_001340 [Prescottella equi]UPH40823.1 hypothetical protein MWT96_20360 [Prescottella equi]